MMYSYDYLLDRGVSRLCHSTKLKDLIHIISSDSGVASTNVIRSDIKDQKDLARYDGELEYICCSVEYPNWWYLRNVRQRDTDQVFKDWVTIFMIRCWFSNFFSKTSTFYYSLNRIITDIVVFDIKN